MELLRRGAKPVATIAACSIMALLIATPALAKPKRAAPDTGKFPAGTMQIVISISKQRATVFNDGRVVGEAPVSTGVAGHPTPLGVFAVIGKARYHQSNIYSGAPMPYMHRITWSGIALHEGMLPGYPASHGCIRMPGAFVSRLFAATKLGTRVVITRDPVAPVDFANEKLFVPRAAEDFPLAVSEIPDAQRVIERAAIESGLTIEKTPEPTPVRVAEAKNEVTGSATLPAIPSDNAKLPQNATPAIAKPIAEKRKGAVQVFVSRKDGKMYVRQDFMPLFDAPVTITEPEKPWGTHVFTAMAIDGEKVRWTALSIPSGFAGKVEEPRGKKISQKEIERREKRAYDLAHAPSAAVALERFDLPKEAVARIGTLLGVGSSLIVSDNGLSYETGNGTDFVVTTE